MAIIIKNLDRTLDRKSMSAVRGGAWPYSGMNMFNVQTIVSDRQRESQVASNITHALDNGVMQVIGNIK
jgi:hypothetical protein